MKKYLEIAKFTRTQGLKGELRAEYYCDNPDDIGNFATLYLGNEKSPVKAEYIRLVKNIVIIKLAGIETATEAVKLSGKLLYIDRNDASLEPDTWFIQDIIGLRVLDADTGEEYGKVKEILQNAPTDVYIVEAKDGKELLFPSIPEVLLKTDTENGEIHIRPLEGLFD